MMVALHLPMGGEARFKKAIPRKLVLQGCSATGNCLLVRMSSTEGQIAHKSAR
jgi:hypothetical protein